VAGHQVVVAQVGGQRDDPEDEGQPRPLAQQLAVRAAPHPYRRRADRAGHQRDDQAADHRHGDAALVRRVTVEELDELHDADDREDDRQPVALAEPPGD